MSALLRSLQTLTRGTRATLLFFVSSGGAVILMRFHQCLTILKHRPFLELPANIVSAVLPDKPAFLSRERGP
jgi:hypothetical protein